jgi:large subunit ribosomal protein L29
MVVTKVKLSEMREHTMDELNDEVLSLRKKLFELRMNLSLRKLENTSEISKTRSQIAQLKTVIKEKQLQK